MNKIEIMADYSVHMLVSVLLLGHVHAECDVKPVIDVYCQFSNFISLTAFIIVFLTPEID